MRFDEYDRRIREMIEKRRVYLDDVPAYDHVSIREATERADKLISVLQEQNDSWGRKEPVR
jgi:hypothetical protein